MCRLPSTCWVAPTLFAKVTCPPQPKPSRNLQHPLTGPCPLSPAPLPQKRAAQNQENKEGNDTIACSLVHTTSGAPGRWPGPLSARQTLTCTPRISLTYPSPLSEPVGTAPAQLGDRDHGPCARLVTPHWPYPGLWNRCSEVGI